MKRNSSFGESKLINLWASRLPSGREGAVVVGGGGEGEINRRVEVETPWLGEFQLN